MDYMVKAREAVVANHNNELSLEADIKTEDWMVVEEVFVVWFCKTLQNFKALLATDRPDGIYYEFTWNGDKDEGYLDVYAKTQNVVVPA